jgi:mRNA-degrading endonuclease RelE of RelBE toxin-antitoxin system
MKTRIVSNTKFDKTNETLIKERKLLREDFDEFKRELAENPERGSIVTGTGGVRKIRLKSASKGKRGGFRVCYFYYDENGDLFLIMVYPKNEKENLLPEEKKQLKALTDEIKRR